MDITNQTLGLKKLFNKNILNYQENPQPEAEKKELPQEPAFTGLNGLKGLGNYAQASLKVVKTLPKMAPAAILLVPGAAALTSCEKTEITENWTLNVTEKSESEELLKQMIELWEQYMKQNTEFQGQILNAIDYLTQLVQAGNDQDKVYYDTVNAMMEIYRELLASIDTNTEESLAIAQQGLDLMNDILAALEENNALISQYGDGIISYMENIQAAIENGNESVIAVLELIWADIQEGNTAIIDSIDGLGSILDVNNDELLNTITEIYENSELSANERNEQIINAINDIKVIVESMESTIGSQTGEVKEILQEFLDQYKEGQITSEKMMELMYNALIEGNTLDKLQLEEIHQIYVSLEDGKLTVSEALAQIAELLGSINETLQGMSSQLNDIFAEVQDINNNIKAGNQANADNFALLLENANQQNKYLEQLVQSNEAQAQLLAKLDTRAEEAINVLNNIKENVGEISLDELYEVLNANNAEVVQTIKDAAENLGLVIDNSTDDAVAAIIEQLEALRGAISDSQTSMTEILEKLNNIDINTALNASQMSELISLVNELKQLAGDDNTTQIEISAKLDEIKDLLANIDSTLTEISGKLSEALDKINVIIEQNDQAQSQYASYFEQLIQNAEQQNTYLQEMISVQNANKENTDALVQQANQIIELLQQANDQLGDLNFSELIAELERLDAEMAAKLQEMIENLGITINDNTNNATAQIIEALQSIMGALEGNEETMDTIINLLSSIDLNTSLSNSQMDRLLSLVEELNAMIDQGNTSQEEINVKLDEIKDYLASIDGTLKDILAKVQEGLDSFNSFYNDYKTNSDMFYQALEDIKNQVGDIAGTVNDIKTNGDQMLSKLDNLQTSADNIANSLEQIIQNQGDDLTYEELQELLANQSSSNLEALQNMLTALGLEAQDYADAKVSELIAAIRASAIDLTTTNNLIQTIINQLSAIAPTIPDNTELQALLQQLIDAYNAGNANINDQLQQANDKLDQLYQTVVDMYGEVVSMADEFSTFLSLYRTNSADILDNLSNIYSDLQNAGSLLGDLNTSMNTNNNYLQTANDKYDDIIERLDNLVANQSNGLTREDLEQVLADAGTTLQAMLDDLGIDINDVNTQNTQDIINAIRGNSSDLTTTNNLIQTLINNTATIVEQMQGMGNQDIVINTDDIEAMLESLQEIVRAGNATTGEVNDQMQQLNVLMKDLLEAIQAQGGSGTDA